MQADLRRCGPELLEQLEQVGRPALGQRVTDSGFTRHTQQLALC